MAHNYNFKKPFITFVLAFTSLQASAVTYKITRITGGGTNSCFYESVAVQLNNGLSAQDLRNLTADAIVDAAANLDGVGNDAYGLINAHVFQDPSLDHRYATLADYVAAVRNNEAAEQPAILALADEIGETINIRQQNGQPFLGPDYDPDSPINVLYNGSHYDALTEVDDKAPKSNEVHPKALVQDARNNSGMISNTINARINHLSGGQNSYLAQAAGEGDAQNGAWISGFVGNNKDKSTDYKSKTNLAGGSIGYERYVGDDSAIGAAITLMNGKTKYDANHKRNSTNYVASIYGLTKVDDFIFSGSVFAGLGNTKSSKNIANVTAKGKSKNQLYGASLGVAYQIQKDQHLFRPSVGVHYLDMNYGSLNEKAGGITYDKFAKSKTGVLTGTLAAKYGYTLTKDNMVFIPAVEVGVARDHVVNNSYREEYLMVGTGIVNLGPLQNKKQTRVFVTPSLLAKGELVDCSLSYTFDKAKKATGHMVALKLLTRF
jgi:hypothetical protein